MTREEDCSVIMHPKYQCDVKEKESTKLVIRMVLEWPTQSPDLN